MRPPSTDNDCCHHHIRRLPQRKRHYVSSTRSDVVHTDQDDEAVASDCDASRNRNILTTQGHQARGGCTGGGDRGGACDCSVGTAPSPSAPYTLVPRLFVEFRGREGGGGGAVLCGGSPASGVAQAGNEERGQNVNYCPPPSTPFTACAHLLYARTPAACCRCGCLF